MWWLWVLGVLVVWSVVGLALAVLVGKGVRLADDRSRGSAGAGTLTTADLPVGFRTAPARPVASIGRRRGPVPLPPVGLGLVVLVLALETSGYAFRLTGRSGPLAQALSMDAPYSVPRLVVAALFAVAAVAAVAGSNAQQGRRTWWFAVAVVAAGISTVKAGSTLHADAMAAASGVIGTSGAVAVSSLLAAAVVAVLFVLSRNERRDRRRVLGALTGYAVAVVGLSAVSSYAAGALDANWTATATFIEESGEALAGVAFLMAVLVGVAPQLVLPREWALRRRADAGAVEAGRAASGSEPGGAHA